MALLDRFRTRRRRPLRGLQVEVTSRCTCRCAICPRAALTERWRDGDLSESHFAAIAADLFLVEHLHLQGWGEPLLHPSLPDWAREAKSAGCRVSLTTNGDLLATAMDWLLDGNVDEVAISLAGDAETHSALCDGSQMEDLLATAGALVSRARDRGVGLRVKASYLLTRRNAEALPLVIELAAEAGLAELFVVHLDCRPSWFLVEQSAFTEDGLRASVALVLDEAAQAARRGGIRYRGPVLAAQEVLSCALDPSRFAYVSFDGRVGPCVNLLLPIAGAIPRWSRGAACEVDPVSYGHLDAHALADLLDSGARRRFVAPFQERLAAERGFLAAAASAFDVPAPDELQRANVARQESLGDSPWPTSCRSCPKAQGW